MDSTKVTIFNKEYSIIGESPEYIEKLASFVDKEIRSAYLSTSNSNTNLNSPIVLAAMNIADKFFKEKEREKPIVIKRKEKEVAEVPKKQNDEAYTLFPTIKSLEENKKLQSEIEKLKSENMELNNLLNKLQNDIFELQMELAEKNEDNK